MLTQEKIIRRSYMAILAEEIIEKKHNTLKELRELVNDCRSGFTAITPEGKKHQIRLCETADFLINMECKVSSKPSWDVLKQGLILLSNDLRHNDPRNHLLKIIDDLVSFMEFVENI